MLIFVLIIVIIALAILSAFSRKDFQAFFSRPHALTVNGEQRTYRLIPSKNPVSDQTKIVLAFHGLGGDGRQIAYFSAIHNSADSDTIIVYPDSSKPKPDQTGIRTGWNAGFCCGSGWVNQVDDVEFIKKLVDKLSNDYKIPSSRIYATGFSNGGMFVQKLATDVPDSFGGFASVSGSIGTKGNELRPTKPIALLMVHGEADSTVPFNGGAGSSDRKFVWNSFDETAGIWETVNKCTGKQKNDAKPTITTYGECQKPLQLETYPGLSHQWPGWRLVNFWHKKTAGSERVLSFFNAQ